MRTFSLPNQTGNAGKFLTTDGQNVSWATAGGGGGGVTSFNTLTGAVVLAAGSGITLTPVGQTITIAATGGGGTPALPEFHIAYGDASNLMTSSSLFQYSPTGRFNVDFTGTHPSLDIDLSAHSYQFGDYAQQDNGTALSIDDFNRFFNVVGKYGGLGIAPGIKLDFTGQTFGFGDTTNAGNGTNVFISDATQKVGINTVNPGAALDIHVLEQPVIQPAQFTGTGTDDLMAGGSMGGNATLVKYTVTIDDGDPTSPNSFVWTGSDGTSGGTTAIDGTPQAIGPYGVTATFASTTGHNTGDFWTIQVTQPNALFVTSTSGTVPLSIANDGTLFIQNASTGDDSAWFDPTAGNIGAWHFGDVDIAVDGGGFSWEQTDTTDNTLWNFNIHGQAPAGHGAGVPAKFFRTDQAGVTVIGDVDSVFDTSIVGTQLVVDTANESVKVFVGGSGSGNGTLEVMTSASATVAPAGYSILYVNPGTDLFAAGDWNQTLNKTAMYIDDAGQTINFKTDGTFNVIGSTSNKTLLAIDGTSEQSTFRSAVFMYNGTPSSNAPIFLSGNGDAKVVIGDAFNNYDAFQLTIDPTTSTANGGSGDFSIHGFHGGIGYFYTDGIIFSKPFSQSYGLQTFTPVSGRLDVGTNTATVTSATTLTLLGTSTASGSQWVEGAQITLILNGGPLVRNNQSPAAGYAAMILTGGVDYQSNPSDIMTFVYNGTAWIQTGLLRSKGTRAGSFSGTGTATTTFTVTIGVTMPNSTYKVTATPSNVLSAAVFYVNNKTTTTFDVVYLAGLTGAVAFDWVVSP